MEHQEESAMNILIPLDGSIVSESVLPAASTLAKEAGMHVTLITVVDPSGIHATWGRLPEPGVPGSTSPFGVPAPVGPAAPRAGELVEDVVQAQERARNEARDYLARVGRKYFKGAAETEVLVGGNVTDEMLDYIKANHVDLIAMATHGRTGLARIVLGSVANTLVTSGVAPILLVRPRNLHQSKP